MYIDNGQTIYTSRTLTYNLCSKQTEKATHTSVAICQELANDCQVPCSVLLLPAQDQPEKTKYAPQTDNIRSKMTFFYLSWFQLPPSNNLQWKHVWSLLFSPLKRFPTTLPVSLYQIVSDVTHALLYSKVWINTFCFFSPGWSCLFPQLSWRFHWDMLCTAHGHGPGVAPTEAPVLCCSQLRVNACKGNEHWVWTPHSCVEFLGDLVSV